MRQTSDNICPITYDWVNPLKQTQIKVRYRRCEVCKEVESRYRCPRCEIETCCLACVNQHKEDNDCNGQRDKTAFVKAGEFSDRHLLSDYRFLEDAGRKTNNACRDELKRRHNKPNFLKELEKQAGNRKINLRFMPYPMTRRKYNSTSYHSRMKKMYWQIEWLFPEVDLTLVDKRISEDESLESVLDRHVGEDSDPLVKHKLKPYITSGKENWSLFMKQENADSLQKRFYKLDLTKSLLENFRHKEIIEYPVIHVVLASHCAQYHLVPENEDASVTDESSTAEQTVTKTSTNGEQTDAKVSTTGSPDCKQDIAEHVPNKPVENVT